MKTALIGHRKIFANTLPQRLHDAIKTEIENGCFSFAMGTHGEFDRIALQTCRRLRNEFPDLQIEVVITSLHAIQKPGEWDCAPYADVSTVWYDIEEAHFKRQITLSNQKMIDACDTLICYVDETAYGSGAKTAMRYAERKGLRILNLYEEQDAPFSGMTREEIAARWQELCNLTSKK